MLHDKDGAGWPVFLFHDLINRERFRVPGTSDWLIF
jgi:hypothetical protein